MAFGRPADPEPAFRHTRDVPCPVCGAAAADPCLLRSGKPLEDVHCTDRISAASGTKPLTTPSEPYTPATRRGTPVPARPADDAPLSSRRAQPEPSPDQPPAKGVTSAGAVGEDGDEARAPAPPNQGGETRRRRRTPKGSAGTGDNTPPAHAQRAPQPALF